MQGQDEELVNTGGRRGRKSSYFSVCEVDFCMSTAQKTFLQREVKCLYEDCQL